MVGRNEKVGALIVPTETRGTETISTNKTT